METDDIGEILNMRKTPPFLRSSYNYSTEMASVQTGLACTAEEGKTQQQFKEETDINTIVERFGLTGHLPENPRMPLSGEDFTEGITDFQTAMNAVRQAEEAFMEFPAHIRAEFENNPQKMIAFLENDKNKEKALEMGLIPKPPEKTRNLLDAVDELSAKFSTANPADKKDK